MVLRILFLFLTSVNSLRLVIWKYTHCYWKLQKSVLNDMADFVTETRFIIARIELVIRLYRCNS